VRDVGLRATNRFGRFQFHGPCSYRDGGHASGIDYTSGQPYVWHVVANAVCAKGLMRPRGTTQGHP